MQDFRKLMVWQKAHELTLLAYNHTKDFPKEELYGLTSQLRRSSSSIAANICEGCGRSTDADFNRYLQMAFGSACETEYHLILALDLGYLKQKDHQACQNLLEELKRMLSALQKKLKADSREPKASS
jgi:four helix bundle protein